MALSVHRELDTSSFNVEESCRSIQRSTISTQSAEECLKFKVCPEALMAFFKFHQAHGNHCDYRKDIFSMMGCGRIIETPALLSLRALAIASVIYAQFPSATIPLKISLKPIAQAKWLSMESRMVSGGILDSITRSEAFACITMFESGGINIEPSQLGRVIAVSAENSIFVASVLLSDPMDNLPQASMKRIIGNIGAPGVSLLVVPGHPRVRSISDDFLSVMHAEYDRRREDHFQGTTLHLSFTGWKVPIIWGAKDYIDQDVHFLGAIISVRNQGSWIADIDVLASLPHVVNSSLHHYRSHICICPKPASTLEGYYVSIDNWNEVLDIPQDAAVVRRFQLVGSLSSSMRTEPTQTEISYWSTNESGVGTVLKVVELGYLNSYTWS